MLRRTLLEADLMEALAFTRLHYASTIGQD